jgi:hypothetical protein
VRRPGRSPTRGAEPGSYTFLTLLA